MSSRDGPKSRSHTPDDWRFFYESTQGRNPRRLLLHALSLWSPNDIFASQPVAVDLGCGDGIDSLALLCSGWRVFAVDKEELAILRLRENIPPKFRLGLKAVLTDFKSFNFPIADFVFAGFSLPFCCAKTFEHIWIKAVNCLKSGGRFAGHLFGDRDSWNGRYDMLFHSEKEARNLFERKLKLELFHESESDGYGFGAQKHWHIFEFIGRKY